MRTGEGICPYFVVSSWFEEGVSLIQREAFFTSKKRPLQMEKGVSFFVTFGLVLIDECFLLPFQYIFSYPFISLFAIKWVLLQV